MRGGLLAVGLLVLSFGASARAESIPIPLEERVDVADRIVIGRIARIERGAEIWTGGKGTEHENSYRTDYAVLAVTSVIKGPPLQPDGSILTIAFSTFVSGAMIICPAPRHYKMGDEGIWLLTERRSMSGEVVFCGGLEPSSSLEAVKSALASAAGKDRSRFALAGAAKESFDLERHGPAEKFESRLSELCAGSDLTFVRDLVHLYASDYWTESSTASWIVYRASERLGTRAAWPLTESLATVDLRHVYSLCYELDDITRTEAFSVDVPEIGVRYRVDKVGGGHHVESLADGSTLPDPTDAQLPALRSALARFWTERLEALKISR